MAKFICNLTWEDAVHLTKEAKDELLSSYSPHERDARTKGIPALGSGALFPVSEADVVVESFRISDKWPRVCGLDVGWNRTAAVWGAYDSKSDIWYLYSEYYRGQAEPSIHADAIKARGQWIPCLIDCHSNKRGEGGSIELSVVYEKLGLNVSLAKNGPGTLEPSILDMYQRLSSGRLKVMSHLLNWLAEFRVARRDQMGRIVDKDNHALDASRFILISGQQIAELPPLDEQENITSVSTFKQGRSDICGY